MIEVRSGKFRRLALRRTRDRPSIIACERVPVCGTRLFFLRFFRKNFPDGIPKDSDTYKAIGMQENGNRFSQLA